jgi:diguanylate cyclase (GGDEF)-like protein/PAS domain S-box-containing protein
MKIQLNLNDLHAKLSLTLRFTIATIIFFIALLLRLTIWPAEFGLTFITFYPAAFLSFYLCGTKPGFLVTVLSAFSALYISSPPLWGLNLSNGNIAAIAFFLAFSWLMGYVLTKGYYWHNQLIDKEHNKFEEVDKQLLTTNELLTLAERSVSAGAWRWYIDTGKMVWTEQLFKLFGLDPESDNPSFDSWRKIVHPDDLKDAEDLIQEAGQNLHSFVTFYRVILPTGHVRWIDSYGGPVYDKLGNLIEFSGICINSTSLHLAEQQIQESEQRFRNMFTNLTVGYQALDINGCWLDANQKMAQILGFATPEEMLGQSFIDSWSDTDQEFSAFYQHFKDNNYVEGEFMLMRCDSQPITVIISGRIQRNKEGDFVCAHSVIVDITERQKMEQKIIEMNAELELKIAERTAELSKANEDLRHLSRHDALTGLHNRLSANERLHSEFVSMKRSQNNYAVLLLDIDFFKKVNDTHGHSVGDSVLQQLAQILKTTLRESDFAARYGGEEFLLLLPNTELFEARLVAEKIRHSIEAVPHPVAGKITVSIGVAITTPEEPDEYIAVKEADDNLYAAKKSGRNCIMAATHQ